MTDISTTTPDREQQPTTTFANAREMHRLHPDTFEVPTDEEMAAIAPGTSVMVATGGERFWVTVTRAAGAELTGTVDNDLICTDEHGLRLGDAVRFGRECVYDILARSRSPKQLPPGPDRRTDRQVIQAAQSLTTFTNLTGTDWSDALGDLLTALMHWADHNSFDFGLALDRARGHYEAQTGGEAAV